MLAPKKRAVRDPQTMQAASHHLLYEWWMLQETAAWLASHAVRTPSEQNAQLESFCLHVRNLLDFFYPELRGHQARYGDVIAQDFIRSTEWEAARPPLAPALERIGIRVDKQLAHLTYARLRTTESASTWDFLHITAAVSQVVQDFIHLAEPSLLSADWFPANPTASTL